MDVFHQRLQQEHGESVILTAPTVPYTLQLADGSVERIQNPSKYPVDQKVCLASSGAAATCFLCAPLQKPGHQSWHTCVRKCASSTCLSTILCRQRSRGSCAPCMCISKTLLLAGRSCI